MFWNLIAKLLARPAVVDWLIRRAMRTPYTNIIVDGKLYMERYWLFNPYPDTGGSGADRSRWQFPISIRLHHIVLPDPDRDLHDHPWNARTFILRGEYTEIRPHKIFGGYWDALLPFLLPEGSKYVRRTGTTAALQFGEYHRITAVSEGGVWTLFMTGKYCGTWGFLVEGKKVQWRKYLGLEK